jgi:hypothetical protein
MTVLAAAIGWGPARAGLIISAPSFAAPNFSAGTFDILLSNDGTVPVGIGGFSLDITTATQNIDFVGASTRTTAAPYIYAGDSFVTINGLPFLLNPGTPEELIVSDTPNDGLAPFIAPGMVVSLGEISYLLHQFPGLPGVATVTFRNTITSLSDQFGNPLPVTTVNGEISIIPEPNQMPMIIGYLVVMVLACQRSRVRLRILSRNDPRSVRTRTS